MSRLATAIKQILTPALASGWGIVETIPGPGQVRLQGRPETVLVAGNAMPAVGERVCWMALQDGRLVVSNNLRPPRPWISPKGKPWWVGAWAEVATPTYAHNFGQFEITNPAAWEDSAGNFWTIGFEFEGDGVYELLPLTMRFWRGLAGGLLSPSSWAAKGSVVFPVLGSEPNRHRGGPGFYSTAFLIHDNHLICWWQQERAWRHDTGEAAQFVEGTIDPASDTLSLGAKQNLDFPSLEGFGSTLYLGFAALHRDSDGYLWLAEAPSVTLSAPTINPISGSGLSSGEWHYAMLYVSPDGYLGLSQYKTVYLSYPNLATRLIVPAFVLPPPGTTARWLYRRQPAGEWGRVATFPGTGAIDWEDHGATAGPPAPPRDSPAMWGSGVTESGVIVGKSVSPNTLGDGVVWEDAVPWSLNHLRGGILGLGNGRALVMYRKYASDEIAPTQFLCARLRNSAGVWGEETVLDSGGTGFPSLALVDGEIHVAYRWGSSSIRYGLVPITGDTIGTFNPVTISGADGPARFIHAIDEDQLLMHAGGGDDSAHILEIADAQAESAGDSLDTTGADVSDVTAPPVLSAGEAPALYLDGDDHLGVMLWSEE